MKIFDPRRLLLIAGPCSLESQAVCAAVAAKLTLLAKAHSELTVVFKGSFPEAKQTAPRSRARGEPD